MLAQNYRCVSFLLIHDRGPISLYIYEEARTAIGIDFVVVDEGNEASGEFSLQLDIDVLADMGSEEGVAPASGVEEIYDGLA